MLLRVTDLESGYGKKQVLFGVSLELRPNEVVGLIGPNGAGKSTLLLAICGSIPAWGGSVELDGRSIIGASPPQNLASGIAFIPQGRRVFDELTVRENLEVGGLALRSRQLGASIQGVLDFFPALARRLDQLAGRLSCGEQQMLAVARALILGPRVLLVDEPSLGLSPELVTAILCQLRELATARQLALLIVEQKVTELLDISDRVYGLRLGRVTLAGVAADIRGSDALKGLFLT
jgi:branched-chain amino acid transport system ATP-binding protein